MFPVFITTIAAISVLNFRALIPFAASHMEKPLAEHSMPLTDRYDNPFVNSVFKDNILLALSYMNGKTEKGEHINWSQITSPSQYSFTLKPGQVFAFHDAVLPQFQGRVVQTVNAHFNGQEGFKSDGYLFGDGVCHLASLMYWAARDAGLYALAPTDHSFAAIPDIDKKYGVSIYSDGTKSTIGQMQNLYITNTKEKPVTFAFAYNGINLSVEVKEIE